MKHLFCKLGFRRKIIQFKVISFIRR